MTGRDLRAVTEALQADRPVPEYQRPSIRGTIEWRPGGEPATKDIPRSLLVGPEGFSGIRPPCVIWCTPEDPMPPGGPRGVPLGRAL